MVFIIYFLNLPLLFHGESFLGLRSFWNGYMFLCGFYVPGNYGCGHKLIITEIRNLNVNTNVVFTKFWSVIFKSLLLMPKKHAIEKVQWKNLFLSES